MRYLKLASAFAIAVAFVTMIVAAQGKAVPAMAGILMKLNHFAGDADKKTLTAIVDDKAATAAERTVAQALLNVLHTASAADKAKLDALVKDKATPEGLKTIATIILSLNHTASDAQKADLKKLAGA